MELLFYRWENSGTEVTLAKILQVSGTICGTTEILSFSPLQKPQPLNDPVVLVGL